ncbi:Lipase 1 precursor [compost metagenome]
MYLVVIAGVLGILLLIEHIRCRNEVKQAYRRLADYKPKTLSLSSAEMTYVDQGSGPVILVAHGISGGYDQGFWTLKDRADEYRILAPSRFGYLGSSVPEKSGPGEQAKAYVELLDNLGIEQVYILGTSAGGTVAIRFALDYPERTKGLILYSSAMPLPEKPERYSAYQGPPGFLCNNFAMRLLRPLFRPFMGMAPDTIYTFLPVNERSKGMQIDASVVNLDMAKNYEQYPIENLRVPSLIIAAKDDKLSNFEAIERVLHRFPDNTLIAFEDGGHMMVGHEQEIEEALDYFLSAKP